MLIAPYLCTRSCAPHISHCIARENHESCHKKIIACHRLGGTLSPCVAQPVLSHPWIGKPCIQVCEPGRHREYRVCLTSSTWGVFIRSPPVFFSCTYACPFTSPSPQSYVRAKIHVWLMLSVRPLLFLLKIFVATQFEPELELPTAVLSVQVHGLRVTSDHSLPPSSSGSLF